MGFPMDKIIINDLLTNGIIGTNDWERTQPQDILINLEIFGNFSKAGGTDDLGDCVNYFSLAEKISILAATIQRFTVEALATDIARLCLAESGVKKVIVRVEKPHAIPAAKSAGVEIIRTRQDFDSGLRVENHS
jgi:FolB domain-containing protein